MRQALRWGLLVAQAACIEPAWAPPEPVPVALLTPDVWSGNEAVLASAAFMPDRGLPVVLLNDDTLAVRRLDDTTVAARLPDLPGTQSLRVVAPDVLDFPIAIELRGFESAGWGPVLSGRVQPLPGWPPSVVGSGASEAVFWNLQSGITVPLPDSLHDPSCSRGVGPSSAATGVALVARCGVTGGAHWWSWRLRPGLAMVEDSLCGAGELVAEVAPGRSLSEGGGYPGWISVGVRDSLTCSETRLPTAPRDFGVNLVDVVVSPRGDRAVIFAAPLDGATGLPVLDVATGRIAYELTPIEDWYYSAAAFSAEGETLFVAGATAAGEQVLLALRATDGQPIRSVMLPVNGYSRALAVDPSRSWLYVIGTAWWPDNHGWLLVFDRDSLALRATLVADSASGFRWMGGHVRIVPSPLEQRLFVVWTYVTPDPDDRAFLTRFRTPP